MTEPDLEQRKTLFAELKTPSAAGRKRRQALQVAIKGTEHEFHALGQEMNQRYTSRAIYTADQEHARPALPDDSVLTHQISTYPGARLPHAWLNTRIPGARFSTTDLAGHGAFSLFTGIGGEAWRTAASTVASEFAGLGLNVYSIGWCQDYEDVYGDWARRREVAEDGCVLVRPDRFVCWRAMTMETEGDKGSVDACVRKLRSVLRCVLGWDEAESSANGSTAATAATTAVTNGVNGH